MAALRPLGSVALGALLALAVCGSCRPPREAADLVLLGGRVVTVDDARPEAQAVAVRGETILAVGSDDEIRALVGPSTRVIRLEGRLVVPGFIEAHGHLASLGRRRRILDLRTADTWEEIVSRVAEAARAARPEQWIVGRGWHQEKWSVPPVPAVLGYPTNEALDRAAPRNPVVLTHASGAHAGIANSRALSLGGIDAATPDPPGGKILRDAAGRPTGVLRETALDPVLAALDRARASRTPEEIDADARDEVEAAVAECLSKGVTSFQDAGASFETVDFYRRLADEGRLGVRLWVMLAAPEEALRARMRDYRIIAHAGGRLTVRAIKGYMDGALGSHGAWLLAPYADVPSATGHNTTPIAEIEAIARLALENEFQFCVHAIGDRGNRETLDLFRRSFDAHPGGGDRRWRIEHAQHLAPEDVPLFAAMGVIASMQAVHCVSDAPWVIKRLGAERAREGAYVWRRLIDAGAILANGTDTPVEDVDPIANFHAAVTREVPGGEAFFPEHVMTREEALRAATRDAAYAAFEEDVKGSISPGKLADLVVLSRDILTVSPDEIRSARVLFTIVGGRVVYEAAAPGPS